MKALLTSTALILGMLASAGVYAESAPAGATGLCKDGSYYTGSNKQGACRGHKGVQEWYASTATAATAATPATATTTTTKPAPMPAMSPAATSGTAPAGSTGLCNDGSYYTGSNKQGACRGHKGIKDWYGAATGAAATAVATPAAATTPAAAATPAPEKKGMFSFLNKKSSAPTAAAPNTAAAPSAATTTSATKPVAAGGGAGQVWVNTDSKVYHCQGSQWYGKTKVGQYMTEAAAKAEGARPDHGKACS